MKKLLVLIPLFLFSSCIVVDAAIPVRENLSSTTWVGKPGNPYSVAFNYDGTRATFTFSGGVVQTATYQYQMDFGGYSAALYRLDYDPYGFAQYYYAFYTSGGRLYGNANGRPSSYFGLLTPEYVAD